MTEAASRERPSVLIDTHVLIWYTTAPSMLSATALRVLEDAVAADRPIVIAAVSLIELIYISEKRSDSIDADTLWELLASIQASDSPIAIAPMTVDVAHHMVSVNRTQVRDPFDRTIVATAQALALHEIGVERVHQNLSRPAPTASISSSARSADTPAGAKGRSRAVASFPPISRAHSIVCSARRHEPSPDAAAPRPDWLRTVGAR